MRSLVASFGGADRVGAAHVVGQTRVRRQLGIPARRGDLHRAAASALERGSADQPRRQAGRRRLAGGGRCAGKRDGLPGNMFVPIDRLPPILGELIADGRAQRPGPAVARADHGGAWWALFVARVIPKARLKKREFSAAT